MKRGFKPCPGVRSNKASFPKSSVSPSDFFLNRERGGSGDGEINYKDLRKDSDANQSLPLAGENNQDFKSYHQPFLGAIKKVKPLNCNHP